MSAPTVAFGGFATFIFPILFVQKNNIDAPNCNDLSGFQTLGLINGVPPNDIPASVVIVRLQSPGPSRTFGFEGMVRRRIQSSPKREIGEPLLSNVRMLMFLIGTEGMECLNPQDSYDSTKDICLFKIDVDQFRSPALNVFDCLSNVGDFQFRREKDGTIESICDGRHLNRKVSRFKH